MDNAKLAAGTKLNKDINEAKVELVRWQSATKLLNDAVNVYYKINNNIDNRQLTASPETFTIVKALNVAHFTKLVADLETEFAAL